MTRFIEEERGRFAVEPICRVMCCSPSTYYETLKRPPSLRRLRDESLIGLIYDVYKDNYEVYGHRKVWRQLNRQGTVVARCTVQRLMRSLGLEGARRGKSKKTTIPDLAASRPPDLLDRDFTASRPNQKWLADITYVRTWEGFVHVAFVTDAYSRMIVGWQVATHLRTDLALDALEMALWTRSGKVDGLIHHSDRGSQYTSIIYTERLLEAGMSRRLGRSGIPTTTPWRSPRLACTRPSSSTEEDLGGPSGSSRSPPCSGSICSTTGASTARSATSRRWNSRRLTTGRRFVPRRSLRGLDSVPSLPGLKVVRPRRSPSIGGWPRKPASEIDREPRSTPGEGYGLRLRALHLDPGFTTEGLHRSKRWEKNEGGGFNDLTEVLENRGIPIHLLSTEPGAVHLSTMRNGCQAVTSTMSCDATATEFLKHPEEAFVARRDLQLLLAP